MHEAKLSAFCGLFPPLSAHLFRVHLICQHARITLMSPVYLPSPDHVRSLLFSLSYVFLPIMLAPMLNDPVNPPVEQKLFSFKLAYLFSSLSWFRWKYLQSESIRQSVLFKLLSKSNLRLIPASKKLVSILYCGWLSLRWTLTRIRT